MTGTHDQQIAIRLSRDLLTRLDAFAARLGAGMVGVRLSRADAVRHLLELGLSEQALPGRGPPASAAGTRARGAAR